MASPHEEHRKLAERKLAFALFTVSSSRYKAKARGEPVDDISMRVAVEVIKKRGHQVVHEEIIDDDIEMI
ncbi:MAG: molybdenum cofactor biosynthesis protein, partial [Thaumarchaeota archaeon]